MKSTKFMSLENYCVYGNSSIIPGNVVKTSAERNNRIFGLFVSSDNIQI